MRLREKKVIFIFVNTKTSEFVVSEEQTERNVCECEREKERMYACECACMCVHVWQRLRMRGEGAVRVFGVHVYEKMKILFPTLTN